MFNSQLGFVQNYYKAGTHSTKQKIASMLNASETKICHFLFLCVIVSTEQRQIKVIFAQLGLFLLQFLFLLGNIT